MRDKMLVVFDIDGTLANIEHRLDYVRSKPKNWKAFDAGIPNDAVNPYVAEAFHSLKAAGNEIIFASGRNERSRDDFRGDDIVKREILDEIIADYGRKPDMVFDDRPRVVRMWREEGIFVFNVYQGDEDF